jgi:glycosyltransferase involved in cell wall biosynthesis
MKTKLAIKKLLHQNCFTKVIAYNQKQLTPNSLLWSYHHLGMHQTVTTLPSNHLDCQGLFAKIVSFTICGEFQKVETMLQTFKITKKCHKYRIPLANTLVPFLPKLALGLLVETSPPLTLHTALLLKLEQQEKAYSILKEAMVKKLYRQDPEQLLYFSNATETIEPKKQLTLINMFLLAFHLPKVTLKEKNQPLNVHNIQCHIKKKATGPLVSIIITTYRGEVYLNVAIASILNQTYQNLELIIVNDASDDTTHDIAQEWMTKDKRIHYIKLSHNVGPYIARNIALLQTKGEFVTCHDDDDWSHPLKIERQVNPLLKNKSLVATISSWVRIDQNGTYYARQLHPLMRQNPSSLLFRKELTLKHIGIWDTVKTGADSEFIARLKLVFGHKKVKRIKEPLSFGAHHPNSLMNTKQTGYCNLGFSPERLTYWEAWRQWHIDELKHGKKPFISPNLMNQRKFHVPNTLVVNRQTIQTVIKNIEQKI